MTICRGVLVRLPGQLHQHHIRALEASFAAASGRFGSYNFREYFARKTRHKFAAQLPQVLGTTTVDDQTLAWADQPTKDRLLGWWQTSLDELAVIERASIMNRLFEAPRLVVELAPSVGSPDQPSSTDSAASKTAEPLSEPKT